MLFTVLYKIPNSYGYEVKTVYAIDRATESFLITDFLNKFKWVPMSECELYISEDEE